ncbi:MAG: DUF4235 domain-containing protein [Solirubrobacterales bacterium]|nr:DUF4235 domain-containing protein [Solirubrobacterales bacterium]
MTKILFVPFSVISGFLAGKVATLVFERVWRLVDQQESPEPDQRGVRWPKLIAALLLEGAIYRAVRGAFDRGSRELFTRATGSWPGEQAPKSA